MCFVRGKLSDAKHLKDLKNINRIMPPVKEYYTRVPFGGQYVSHKDRESSKMPVPVSRVESCLAVWSVVVVSLSCRDIMGMQGKFVLSKSIFPDPTSS